MRLSPIRHDVTGYTRKDGKRVEAYVRGSRKSPKKRRKRVQPKPKPGVKPRVRRETGFSVTLFYEGGKETHQIQASNLPDASFKGLQALEAAKIPHKMRLKVT